jgi:hypothetical protein
MSQNQNIEYRSVIAPRFLPHIFTMFLQIQQFQMRKAACLIAKISIFDTFSYFKFFFSVYR